eukprot:g7818.t1
MVVTRSDDRQHHKIGGQFHDDRMKELQQVKEALLGMLAEKSPPGGKNYNFYMSTVVHMVNVTMRASLQEQFLADQALAEEAFKQFETCRNTFVTGLAWPNAILEGGDYGDQTYRASAASIVGADEKTHNDCREIQNQKKQLYDACVDDERIRWETVRAACDHSFVKFYNSVSSHSTGAWAKQCDTQLEVFSNTLPDADPSGLVDLGDTDTEGYLMAQFNYWDKKLEDFLKAEAICKNATAKAEAEKKDCSGKLEAYNKANKDCDMRQDGLDALACQQALSRHTRCSDYDWCYGTAENDWNLANGRTMKQSMCGPSGKEGALDDELALVDQIECVISALSSQDASRKAAQCLNNAPKRDGSYAFPECKKEMPSKEEKQNCGNHLNPLDDPDMAGTVSYVDKYYTGPEANPVGYPLPEMGKDPDHAPPVNVKVCVAPCCTHSEAANKTRGLPPAVNHTKYIPKPEAECATPSRRGEDGYIVYEGSLSIDNFNVHASCADSYKGHAIITPCTKKGEPYKIAGCVPEHTLELPFFSVTVQCKGLGEAKVMPCKKDGEPYVISGCLPYTCKSPKNSVEEGYQVMETSKRLDSWDVKASCAKGYEGTAEVVECQTPLTPYKLSGCKPMKCTMPSAEELRDYEITVVDLQMPSFAVAVKCKGVAEEGTEAMVEPCFQGDQPFTLKNCKPMACTSPRASMEDGYTVFESSKQMHDFDVKASCAQGYKGAAKVQICTEPEGPYELSGCGPKRCVEPGPRASRDYELKVISREIPSFNVQAQCRVGASGTPKVSVCSKDGGPFTLEGRPDACRAIVSTDFNSGYTVYERSLLLENFNVSATCAPSYKGTPIVSMCKEKDLPYTIHGCEPTKCTLPDADAAYDYDYTVRSIEKPSFKVEVVCKSGKGQGLAVECHKDETPFTLTGCEPIPCTSPVEKTDVKHAYQVTQRSLSIPSFNVSVGCIGKRTGPPKAMVCEDHGEPYKLEGCAPLLCESPSSMVGYDVVENLKEILGFDVTAECSFGYTGVAKVQACKADGEPYVLSGCTPIVCSEPPEEEKRDYEITLHSLERPSFSISTRCRSGVGTGRAVPCKHHGDAYHLVGCKPASCTSPRLTLGDGYVVYETSLTYPNFQVNASCADGYTGKAVVRRCRRGGEPYEVSGCSAPKCTEPKSVPHRYTYKVYSLEKPSFSVAVRCRGHNSSIPKAVPCEKDGEPFNLTGCLPLDLTERSLEIPSFSVSASCKTQATGPVRAVPCTEDGDSYTLEGCLPGFCTSPAKKDSEGFVVYEAYTQMDRFSVSARCGQDYDGTATVTICSEPGEPYKLGGCHVGKCIQPSNKYQEAYELTVYSLERPSFSVSAQCRYANAKGRALPCSADGQPFELHGCPLGECLSPVKTLEDGYVVYEASKRLDTFNVSASCAAGYRGVAAVEETKRGDPEGGPKSSAEAEDGYVVYEASKALDSFNVSAKCAEGYKGMAEVQKCAKSGEAYSISGCTPESCSEPSVAEKAAYDITVHSLERPSFSISVACKTGDGSGTVVPCPADGMPYELKGCGVTS